MNCPVCRSDRIDAFLSLPDMPVASNMLWSTPEAARAVRRAGLELARCGSCGHLFNTSFDPSLLDYTESYENSLSFSPVYREYARASALGLIERYALQGRDIVEIGCGKGDFLALLCDLGENRGTGFDKSFAGGFEGKQNLTFIQDFYSEKYADVSADLVLCRQVLEHIAEPRPFLTSLAGILRDRQESAVVFEVPNGLYMLEENRYWDLIYEHCGYYTPTSLSALFTLCGFTVESVEETFGRQYLVIHARPGTAGAGSGAGEVPLVRPEEAEKIEAAAARFARDLVRTIDGWKTWLAGNGSRRITVWGAGTKGIGFVNILKADESVIPYIVDLNPKKHGRFLTGTGQRIVSPEFLSQYLPEIVVVMNPLYLEEIRRTIGDLQVPCTITAADGSFQK